MKLLITGGRDYDNQTLFDITLDDFIEDNPVDIIVVGDCKTGADKYARIYAEKESISVQVFEADWEQFGKSAGPLRNSQMANYLTQRDYCIAFHDGKSKGTRDMIGKAINKLGANRVKIINY